MHLHDLPPISSICCQFYYTYQQVKSEAKIELGITEILFNKKFLTVWRTSSYSIGPIFQFEESFGEWKYFMDVKCSSWIHPWQ